MILSGLGLLKLLRLLDDAPRLPVGLEKLAYKPEIHIIAADTGGKLQCFAWQYLARCTTKEGSSYLGE